MCAMKILCVEDHPEYLAILTCALERIGYEVMPARNEGQAIHLLTKQSIDGVLLEDNLSDVTGSTLRSKLKAIRPESPSCCLREWASRPHTCCGSSTPIYER